MKHKIFKVRYLDSAIVNHQSGDSPIPVVIDAVGFLVEETPEYITIAREVIDDEWRGQLSIPKVSVAKRERL